MDIIIFALTGGTDSLTPALLKVAAILSEILVREQFIREHGSSDKAVNFHRKEEENPCRHNAVSTICLYESLFIFSTVSFAIASQMQYMILYVLIVAIQWSLCFSFSRWYNRVFANVVQVFGCRNSM